MWWRFWSTVVRTALKMLQLKPLNLLLRGRRERCRLVKQMHSRTRIKTYIDVTRLTVTLIFFQVVPVMLHLLTSISSVRLYIPKDLRPFDNRQLMLKSIQVQDVAILNTKKWHS